MAQVYVSFDFGLKRIGVAVGQSVTKSAKPLTTLQARDGQPNWLEVQEIIKTWHPAALIVGIPLNMDGTEQAITGLARKFIAQLEEKTKLPVHGVDERLSTVAAREQTFKEGGYKALKDSEIDSIAAQIILQDWLNH